MVTIEQLEKEYTTFKKEDSLLKNISQLKKDLLSNDTDDILEFHYQISNDLSVKEGIRNMIKSFFYSDIENKRDKEKVIHFLLKKLNETSDNKHKGELLRILGHLRSSHAKELAEKEISSSNYDLRYNSIIVLGWTGIAKDLIILNNQMINDSSPLLRGYCATAMRQIWHRHPETKDQIAQYIYKNIINENENDALVGMIITIQDIFLKKFGIKESHYGDLSGNVLKVKEKAISFLTKRV